MLVFAVISTILLIVTKSTQRIGFYDKVLDHETHGKGFATVRVTVLELE